MHDSQYPIVAARRQAFDALLWQVPALFVAAQGFLLSTAVSDDTDPRLVPWVLGIGAILGFGVILLFHKLRFLEVRDSRHLRAHETKHRKYGFAVVHGVRAGISTYWIWFSILVAAVLVDLGGIVVSLSNAPDQAQSRTTETSHGGSGPKTTLEGRPQKVLVKEPGSDGVALNEQQRHPIAPRGPAVDRVTEHAKGD